MDRRRKLPAPSGAGLNTKAIVALPLSVIACFCAAVQSIVAVAPELPFWNSPWNVIVFVSLSAKFAAVMSESHGLWF